MDKGHLQTCDHSKFAVDYLTDNIVTGSEIAEITQ